MYGECASCTPSTVGRIRRGWTFGNRRGSKTSHMSSSPIILTASGSICITLPVAETRTPEVGAAVFHGCQHALGGLRGQSHFGGLFASDDDTLPFETTLARHVERRDPAERALLGVSVGGTEQQFRGGSTSHLVACTANMALCRNPAVISEGSDCCVVSSQGGRWLYDERNGTARYHPSQTQVFGGTGMLLSRGLVHAMSQRAWTNCARRLVCGPADYRLVTCLRNSLAFELVHVDDNAEFARHALQDSLLLRCKDRQEKRAVSLDFNVYTNMLWSTMYKDPVHGPMLLQQVARECPWSMHKLEAPCVQDVFHANPACHSLKPRRSHHKHAPCWEWIDRKERSRVRRQHSWSDWNSTDLQALLLRELGCESVSGVHQPRASGFGGNPGRGVLRTILPAGEAQARAARRQDAMLS